MPQSRKVFLSSTRRDLYQYREAARNILKNLGVKCRLMEDEVQTGLREDPTDVSIQWLRACDWFVLIIGWHFGTVPANGQRSITQQEFDFAESLLKTGDIKRLFVYFSGDDDGTDEAYRWEGVPNIENLASYSETASAEMTAFRDSVKSRHARSFRNLDDFARKLRDDLDEALQSDRERDESIIDGLTNQRGVKDWIIGQRPKFEHVVEQVGILHQLKSIHDILHHLRQDVILQLQGVVLPSWPEDEKLPVRLGIYLKATQECSGSIEKLKERIAALYESETLPDSINVDIDLLKTVATCEGFGVVSESEYPDRRKLDRDVNNFSIDVQWAFSMMNAAMQKQANVYERSIGEIHNSLENCKRDLHINADEFQALSRAIDVAVGFGRHLSKVLDLHDEWQTFHDDFMRIDSERDVPVKLFFSIDNFISKRKTRLESLIKRSNGVLLDDPEAEPAESAADPLISTTILPELRALPEADDGSLGKQFESNRAELFFRMRQEFDNVFFTYDGRVLGIVHRARRRTKDAREGLFRLRGA